MADCAGTLDSFTFTWVPHILPLFTVCMLMWWPHIWQTLKMICVSREGEVLKAQKVDFAVREVRQLEKPTVISSQDWKPTVSFSPPCSACGSSSPWQPVFLENQDGRRDRGFLAE